MPNISLPRVNLRQLEAFEATRQTGSVTQAADLLGLSQPTISVLIAKLEEEVGFSLFQREKGRLQKTPESDHFYHEVRKALTALNDVAKAAKDIRELKKGGVRIASHPGLALVFLPEIIARLLKHRPQVTVGFEIRNSRLVVDLVATGHYDVGVAEPPISDPAVSFEKFSIRCHCILPEGHPLAEKEVLTPGDLDGVPFISLYPEHPTSYAIQKVFDDARAHWNRVIQTQHFAPACTMVACGAGVSIISAITADDHRGKGIAIRRFEPAVLYEISLLRPRQGPLSRLSVELSDMIRDRLEAVEAREAP